VHGGAGHGGAADVYAADAVRVSLQPLTWVNRLKGPVGTRVNRVTLPARAAATRLGRGITGACIA
jgi:hypothetical protein